MEKYLQVKYTFQMKANLEDNEKFQQWLWKGMISGSLDPKLIFNNHKLPIPGPAHPVWKTWKHLSWSELTRDSTLPYHVLPFDQTTQEMFVWNNILKTNLSHIAVHYGYLTPRQIRRSPHFNSLPSEEVQLIPEGFCGNRKRDVLGLGIGSLT